MREDAKTWFDDPEWDRLRHEVNQRPVVPEKGRFKLFGKDEAPQIPPAQQYPADNPRAPTPVNPVVQPLQPVHQRPFRAHQPALVPPETRKPADPEEVNISVKLTLPKLKVPDHPLIRKARSIRLSKRQWIMTGAACLIVVTSFTGIRAFNRKDDGVDVQTGVLGQSATPEYKPVLPDGSERSTSSNQVLYDPEKKVASYKDTISGINITVSQQPMPDSFSDDPDGEVKKLAENFSATKEIKAGGLTGYLGTSAKGPQSMVLKKRNMLIFIFSEKTIPDQDWGIYISSLE